MSTKNNTATTQHTTSEMWLGNVARKYGHEPVESVC